MAAYYAEQPWTNAPGGITQEQYDIASALHDELCAECHENVGHYQDKEIPRLAGQWPDYLLTQMVDYQSTELRMPQPDKMRRHLEDLTPPELQALAVFYADAGAAPTSDPQRGGGSGADSDAPAPAR